MAMSAHSPGRSGLVSRHAEPRTSAVLREATVPPPPCEGADGDRDPQAGLARGDGEICLRVRGFLADGVERGRTRSGRDGDVGSFAWPIRAGYPATHNPVRPRFCAERPRRPPRPAAALQGSGSAIVSRRPGGRGARSAAGFADSSGTGVKPVRTGE